MKKIAPFLLFAFVSFSSCTYYVPDVKDGESFFKVNWVDQEPTFIHPGGVIPINFRWNTYYRTYPGTYFFNYEYEYNSRRGVVVYPYEIEIEVWNVRAESRRDGDDVFFELVLFPGGDFDYIHVFEQKSFNSVNELSDVATKTLIRQTEEVKNGVKVQYSYYKLPSREKEAK